MLPTIAIIGRPNVGKSTLFNALTKTRDALVADQPGLTRDRKFGRGYFDERMYWVVDTGGINPQKEAMVEELVTQQAWLAVREANQVLFLVDAREGLTATDEEIARKLRQLNTPIHLVINKAEGISSELAALEFHRLGFPHIHTISAAHRQGIEPLLEEVLSSFAIEKLEEIAEENHIKIAVVGRPNVGKSTLVNRILGYERVIVFDQPGTTRDSIAIPFERDQQSYILIDTAGVRRRARTYEMIEKFSVIKTLQSIEDSHVVLMLLDAREGMTDQDAHLLGNILEAGRALVVAINKWDGLSDSHREEIRYHLSRKLHFIDFAKIHFISALHGSGVGNLFESIKKAWHSAHQHIHTSRLNQVLQRAVLIHTPPTVRGRPVKLRYVHQAGRNPPVFVVHGNQIDEIPETYKRYLINVFRKEFDLEGTPIRLELKQGENPFEGRRNPLTPRQQRKKRRLMGYVKKKH